jgi:hypothetical protein
VSVAIGNCNRQSQIANRKSEIIMQNPPFLTAKPRVRRKRRSDGSSAPPAPPLMLVSGVYISAASIRLSFDRPIDIDGLNSAVFIVNDNDDVGEKFEGSGGGTLLSATTVQITITPAGGPSGTGITLTASAANGIVAVDDGGTWAGVTDFALSVP